MLVVISPGLGAGGLAGDATVGDAEVRKIFATLRENLNQLHSIRYKAVTRSESLSKKNPLQLVTVQNDIDACIKNEFYLVKTKTTNSEIFQAKTATHAYDGREFQQLDESKGTLITNTSIPGDQVVLPYKTTQPITIMFAFALELVARRDFQALKAEDLWDRLAERSEVVGHDLIKSIPCTIIKVGRLESIEDARIYLADTMGYYPVKVEFTNHRSQRTDLLEAFVTSEAGGHAIVVPTSVATTTTVRATGKAFSSKMIVEPGSLSINVPVRNSVFTLPKNQAPIRVDMAKKVSYKDGDVIIERSHNLPLTRPDGRSLDTSLLVGSMFLFVCGGMVLAYKKFRKVSRAD